MRRRTWVQLALSAAVAPVAGAAQTSSASSAAGAKPALVRDGRLTHPLAVPASGEIKVAFLLSADAEVVDIAGPWGVFDYTTVGEDGRKPFQLYTVAASKEPVKVSGSMTLVPNHSFADAPRPDVVVVPAMDTEKLAPAAVEWLRSIQQDATLTMSVCNGSHVLAHAGLLDGKRAAAHHGSIGIMRALYPKVTVVRGLRYIEEGKLATSGGLTSGIDLALRVVERYFGRDAARQTARQLEYQSTGWMNPKSNAEFAKKPVGTRERPVCPVCEAQLIRSKALTLAYQGKTWFFCSDWCRDQFKAQPKLFSSLL